MKTLLIIMVALPQALWGAFEPSAQGGRAAGMQGAMVACTNDPWAAFHNPALLATVTEPSLCLAFSPALFGLKEITRISFSGVEPTTVGTFALSGSRFGFALYRELSAGLSYGTMLGESMAIGGSLFSEHLGIRNYGSAWTVVADLGAAFRINPWLTWGISVRNVSASTIGDASESLPEIMSTGFSSHPVREATISMDLVKDLRYPLEIRAGMEYVLLGLLSLRAGMATEPSCYSAGAGIRAGVVQLDYALGVHPVLGLSHQFSLSILPDEM